MGRRGHGKNWRFATQSLAGLLRRPSFRSPRARLLIVCEDSKSAPAYFNSLRQKLRLSTVEITVDSGTSSDPDSVVRTALKRCDETNTEARNSLYMSEFDEVWCAFDRETPGSRPQFQSIVQFAKDSGLRLAVSNPCFEFWTLLHFEHTTRSFKDCSEVVAHLKRKHLASYRKGGDNFASVEARIEEAIERAMRILRSRFEEFPLPCTYVHHLVKKMQDIAGSSYI